MGVYTPDKILMVLARTHTFEELLEADLSLSTCRGAYELKLTAVRYAESAWTLGELISSMRDAVRQGLELDAWALREAVAIRIVDHPNETGREATDGTVLPG